MTTRKIISTPTTKEPIINQALAASSAFNLKLCHMPHFGGLFSLCGGSEISFTLQEYFWWILAEKKAEIKNKFRSCSNLPKIALHSN